MRVFAQKTKAPEQTSSAGPGTLGQRRGRPGWEAEPAASSDIVRSPGRRLHPGLRSFMESRFGHDFGRVRVHADPAAARSARSLDARAYAVGEHVVFGGGEYVPERAAGRTVIAHELAHVIQQRRGGARGGAPDSPAMERAAERAARAARLAGGRFAVSGAARAGVARLPRSLGSSQDTSRWSPWEIETEIREIRQWLREHPQPSEDRQWLLGVLRSLERSVPGVVSGLPDSGEAFAAEFNREFETILPELGPDTPGGELSADRLAELFTVEQRQKLADFMVTRRIPERLFNGAADIGGANAQQRILVSAHILTVGTYRPGSVEQRVHARYCGHWVQVVHQYAGAVPARGGWPETRPTVAARAVPRGRRRARGAVMGGFDPMGVPVICGGESETVFRGSRMTPEEFPIPADTGHAETAAREAEQVAEDPTTRRRVHRRTEMSMARFGELQAGDWIYLYNANRSASGQHSVIFVRFIDETPQLQEGIPYRRAIVYNQPHPESGGVERTIYLGEQFVTSRPADHEHGIPYRHQIDTITLVTRVASSSRPAESVPELLPEPRRPDRIVQQNTRYLQRLERRLHAPVDRHLLTLWLRDQNARLIDGLGDRVTDAQRTLFMRANSGSDMETLVRLCQRLRALTTNAGLFDRTRQETEARLTARHEAEQTRLDELRQQLAPELATLDAQLTADQARADALNDRPTSDQIREQRAELRRLERQLRRAPRGEERTRLRGEKADVRSRIRDLRNQRGSERRELSTLRRQIRRARARQARLQRQLAQAEARLPFGLLPGRVGGEDPGYITGRLQDLAPPPPWSELVLRSTPAASRVEE